jgi:formate/nitrite transporter FocA (FNT family)
MNDFIKSVFAGLCIGIAGTAYVALGGGLFAACLFAVGLISIVLFDFNLYTGKIGYIKSYKDIPKMLLILLGNIIGCMIIAATSGVRADALVEAKLLLPW